MNAVNRIAASVLAGCFGVILSVPLEAFAEDVANGQLLYMDNCAGCHGEHGISVMDEAPNLARFDMVEKSDQDLIEIIQSGGGMMPPYIGVLNEDEILDVVSFLRTLN